MGVPRERAESVYTMILDMAQSVGFIQEIKGKQYIDLNGAEVAIKSDWEEQETGQEESEELPTQRFQPRNSEAIPVGKELGQAIFIAHGKKQKAARTIEAHFGPVQDSLQSCDR